MQDFRNLLVWQKAHDLTLLIYRLTVDFPREELFGLRTQLRKTVIEIPAYVAEGAGKADDAEFFRSVSTALSHASRLEYYLLVSHDLEMLNRGNFDRATADVVEVKKMLVTLRQKLK